MRRIVMVAAAGFLLMALYSFAGTSDQLDGLTIQQKQEVVARQYEVVPVMGR